MSGEKLSPNEQAVEPFTYKLTNKLTEKCGMGVNPAKTELVLFTRKHRIPDLVLPALNDIKFKTSKN